MFRPQLMATREKGLGMRKRSHDRNTQAFCGMGIKDADGAAGKLGQLHRAWLHPVNRPARTIRGKYRRMSALRTALASASSPLPPERAARSPRSQIAEPF